VQVSPADPAAGAAARTTRLVQTPALARLRNRIEDALVPHPFNLYGTARIAELAPAAGHPGPFVPTMGGYRMSFRTAAVRSVGFDATLGSRVGYAQHEDKDVCMRLMRAGWLIAAAPGARVFHNVHPGRRARGFAYGFFQIFNYAYICAGAFAAGGPPAERRARAAVPRYLRYKAFLYGLRRGDAYARAVHAGARAALAEVPALMAAAPADLPARYAALTGRHAAAIGA
jgi:GT2 family glycosyltransferase